MGIEPDDPSRTVIVEPMETPERDREPAREEPAPEPRREDEPVPA